MFRERKREIGDQAVWSVSSAKPGSGVEHLRDGNLETFWQSDDLQPHFINIQFHRKQVVDEIRLYANQAQDESYTPERLVILSGTTFHDLIEIQTVELPEMTGWCSIKLHDVTGGPLRTNFLQIAITNMFQSGRDTHVRQCQVLTPDTPVAAHLDIPTFAAPALNVYTGIR
mmetsp:Transcript_6055/g.15370  ORF Transcript_6055/g.15370 Transcript_6055/m.15370 type:complete len:171 (+) Transcript_6055:35-547(+)